MNFLFACGGTAGHINPAIAVAGRLRELMPECGILFVGARGRMEEDLVPRAGYEIRTVEITNLQRKLNLEGIRHNLATARNVVVSLSESKKIIREFQPDVVVGTGGYVCYPVLRAAQKLGIPTVLHESNAVPGLTTKMLAGHVDRMMVGFEESRDGYKNPDKVAVTGTPVRGDFRTYSKSAAKAELGIDPDKPLVVSVWGSLGAQRMNELMADFITDTHNDADFCLIHSAGTERYEEMLTRLKAECPGGFIQQGFDVRPYIYDMSRVMAAADLVLCRAGASTLSELAMMGKPAVLVPSPNVTNNHQEKNARALERAGAAVVALEQEVDGAGLFRQAKALLDDRAALAEMGRRARSLAKYDALDRIYAAIVDTVG